ncbi:MAG: hypothetical protein M1840_000589 [Geoglossum simile]|nr:MAG: hypothetical protein M1840_000589 [Geoglossum simile]
MARGQRRGNPSNQVFTPEYYRKRLHRFANGPRAKLYADSTNIRLNWVDKMWQEYCLFSEQDPHHTLEECSVEVLENFLHWTLNNTKIKKRSSLQTYWRFFGLLYAKQTGRQMDKLVAKEIQACINSLTVEHNLGVMDGPKPLLDVNDLLTILRYHWTSDCRTFSHERLRVQLALILLVAAYTATRPGAIVERPYVKGSNKVLCYKDIELTILRNPELGKRDVLVMGVTLLHTKGGQGQKKPKTYLFHEDTNLVFCPITLFLALAFADKAFAAPGLTSPEQLFALKVLPGLHEQRLPWKESILNVPVFRRSIRSEDGIRVSPNQALPYFDFHYSLKQLGRATGFLQTITTYCIRRATGNAIDGAASTAVRNLIMGHSNSQIFEQYYLSRRVRQDVQAAYLGRPSEDALIKTAGQMSRSLDPRLPKTLNVDQSLQADCHPMVQALSHSKQIIRAEIILQYGKIKNAVGTPIHNEYMRTKQNFINEKAYQKKALLKELRNRHHREAAVNDIQQQLSGSLVLDLDGDVPGTIAHTFAERSRIAKALFPLPTLKTDEDYGQRVEVIKDLAALCGLREGRRRPVHKDDNKSDSLQLQSFSLKCEPLQCVFCLDDESLGNRREESLFSRKDALRRHVEVTHLGGFTENGEIYCGHPVCKEAKVVLAGVSRFKNHVARVHGVFM